MNATFSILTVVCLIMLLVRLFDYFERQRSKPLDKLVIVFIIALLLLAGWFTINAFSWFKV